MVKIRMRRTGCKSHAAYRIVAADERSPRDGKFLEILGWYDTAMKDDNFKLNMERVDDWLKRGAKHFVSECQYRDRRDYRDVLVWGECPHADYLCGGSVPTT